MNTCGGVGPSSQANARRNVPREHDRLRAEGIDPSTAHQILDCDVSESWCGVSTAKCPCLTHSRRQGFWLVSHGARLSVPLCARLQGIPHGSATWSDNAGTCRALLGNAMSLNAVERILHMVMGCMGVGANIGEDGWASGERQCALVHDAWGASVPSHIVASLPSYIHRRLRCNRSSSPPVVDGQPPECVESVPGALGSVLSNVVTCTLDDAPSNQPDIIDPSCNIFKGLCRYRCVAESRTVGRKRCWHVL